MSHQPNSLKVAQKRLVVLGQALDADWFNGRRHRRLNLFDQWKADLWIHDSGHAVIFSNRKMALTEILVSSDIDLPKDRLIWERTPVEEGHAMIHPGGELEFQMNYELELTEPVIHRYLSQELLVKPSLQDLVWQGNSGHRFADSPIVRVHVESGPGYLSVQTYHTFPAETAILRTQSLYEIQPH